MKGRRVRGLTLYELAGPQEGYAEALIRGLTSEPRQIPCKFFYDQRGSELFERITELDAYYLTRTELAIMQAHAAEMASRLGSECLLVEFGSGSSLKIRVLLDHLDSPAGYIPIDISRDHLIEAASALQEAYPSLTVAPVWADYTRPVELPPEITAGRRRVVYFPGSTIGNFGPGEARAFLGRIAQLAGPGGGLLIGVDLPKDAAIIERAYDDEDGVTADFNLNLLVRANVEVGTDFDLGDFHHLAVYNPRAGRVEIFIVSLREQDVHLGEHTIHLTEGERILTEYSYKYDLEGFAELAHGAGLRVDQVWTDPKRLFSVQFLEVLWPRA